MTTAIRPSAEALSAFAEEALECESCQGEEQWYHEKGAWIRLHARRHGRTAAAAIAAYAVMSANLSVAENDRMFLEWVQGEEVAHFPEVIARLDMIERGDIAEALTYKRGRKITTFAHNLRFPHRAERATIDRHSMRLLVGGCPMCAKANRARKNGYAEAEAIHEAEAARRGMTANGLQARTWVHLVECLGRPAELCEAHEKASAPMWGEDLPDPWAITAG